MQRPESPLAAGLEALVPRLREVRHDIHRHPELGFEEERTQRLVMDWLTAHGYAPRPMAETGVVADLEVDPGRGFVALRADLDALPMQERTELPYKSVHEGRAHKCGHDGHTTILLGVAAQLARHRDRLPGNVRLLFQPAEEGVRGGGAKVMVREGVLDRVAEVYGLHNWPPFPKGAVRVAGGPAMAEVTHLSVRVHGVGGHASQPQAVRDPVVAAAHFITAAQTVVSRNLSSHEAAVVSFSTMHAGRVHNVIPSQAALEGTIRTFSDEVTERVRDRLRTLAGGLGEAFDVKIEIELTPQYPVLVNDEACAQNVARVGQRVVGEANVSAEGVPITGGEDFAFYTREVAGAYFFLGAGEAGRPTYGCHHPDFDFDDDLLPLGIRMFLGLVEDRGGCVE